jgi:MFS family permease
MMGLAGLFAYEFSVSLPVLAERTFHGGAEAYGFMTAAMGIGAVIGGLFTAARGRTGLRPMIIASAGFGAAIGVCAFAPFLGLTYAALLFVGWASVSFIAIGNSTIQLSAEPSMRGRVIALWQVAFQGTTPAGGPAIGWIIALTDPRIGLAAGGASCFAAAIGGAFPNEAMLRALAPLDPRRRGQMTMNPDADGPAWTSRRPGGRSAAGRPRPCLPDRPRADARYVGELVNDRLDLWLVHARVGRSPAYCECLACPLSFGLGDPRDDRGRACSGIEHSAVLG